jgi:hypothetical protein
LFSLFSKQLRVVAREFLQRNEEISKDDLEAIEIFVSCEKSVYEGSNLGTIAELAGAQIDGIGENYV